jgi:hypothetical protein
MKDALGSLDCGFPMGFSHNLCANAEGSCSFQWPTIEMF